MEPTKFARALKRRRGARIRRWLRRIGKWTIYAVLVVFIEVALLYSVAYALSLNILNAQIVVSFLAVELLAAIILYLFGIGRGKESLLAQRQRAISIAAKKARLIPEFAHLTIHFVEEERIKYPDALYYVVNEKTSSAYWIPDYLQDLVAEDIVSRTNHKDESAVEK